MDYDYAEKLIFQEGLNVEDLSLDEEESVRLAKLLREICYERWTVEPSVAQKISEVLIKLAASNTDSRIDAVRDWVTGISEITRGEMISAASYLKKANLTFSEIEDELSAAETVVALMIPLGMLGNYEEAVSAANTALETFTSERNLLQAGKIELNLSNIVARQGDNLKARSHAESALRFFEESLEDEWIVLAENDLAHTLTDLAEFELATEHFTRALANATDAEMYVTEAEILASIGNMAHFRGEYADALRNLELSREKFEYLEMPHQSVVAELEIAEIYQELNLTTEALEIYSVVCDKLAGFKMQSEEARARLNYGRILARTGESEGAHFQLEIALSLYSKEGNQIGEAKVGLSLSELSLANKNGDDALEHATHSFALLDWENSPLLKLQAALATAVARIQLGEKPNEELTAIVEKSEDLAQPSVRAAALTELGQLALKAGDLADAEQILLSVIQEIDSLRAPLGAHEFRMSFFADKTRPYELLTRLYLENGFFEKAFETIESSRGRTLFESRTEDDILENDELSKVRSKLNLVYKQLREQPSEESLQKKASKLEVEFERTSLRIKSLSEANSGFGTPNESVFESAKALSQKGECFVEYIVEDDSFSALVITNGEIQYLPHLALREEVEELLEKLKFQFGTLRYQEQLSARFHEQINHRTNLILEALYDLLFLPMEEEISEKLTIVPVGSLFYVPFCALFDGEEYLVEKCVVSVVPSARILLREKSVDAVDFSNALILSYGDEDIPLIEIERKAVEATLGSSTSFVGSEATVSSFMSNAEDADIIHFACHGEFRADNPNFSNLRLADGHLTVRDISKTRLKARLVTLSACETGVNKIFPGDEILGLSRGFITAGAENIVLTLWRIDDSASSELMIGFYQAITNGSEFSDALRSVQSEFVRKKLNPYYWASFSIIGR